MAMQPEALCCCCSQNYVCSNFLGICKHKFISIVEFQMNILYVSIYMELTHERKTTRILAGLVDTEMHFVCVCVCHRWLCLSVSVNLIWLIACCRYSLFRQPSWICRFSVDFVISMHVDLKYISLTLSHRNRTNNALITWTVKWKTM